MVMAIHCMPVHHTLILSFLNFKKKIPKYFFTWFHNNKLISNIEKRRIIELWAQKRTWKFKSQAAATL